MKALADRRARVARVRQVQHLQTVNAAAIAEGKVVQLEDNAARLAGLRSTLVAGQGATSGAALARSGELAQRLDSVRQGLTDAIGQARSAAALRLAERLDAHIKREGAERLETRAVAEMQRIIEERMAAAIRPNLKGGRHG